MRQFPSYRFYSQVQRLYINIFIMY